MITILGAVIMDGMIVQGLTDYIWVGLDSILNESHIANVTRILYALKTNLEKLKLYLLLLIHVTSLQSLLTAIKSLILNTLVSWKIALTTSLSMLRQSLNQLRILLSKIVA